MKKPLETTASNQTENSTNSYTDNNAHKSDNVTPLNNRHSSEPNTDEFLQAAIICCADAAFAIDTNGIVRIWNQEMETLTGVSADSIVGKGGYEHGVALYGKRMPCAADLLLNPDPAAESRYECFSRNGDTITAISIHRVRGSQYIRLWIRAKALRDAKGQVIGAIETIRDITISDRAFDSLQTRNEWLREMFEHISSGIAVYEAVDNGSDFIIRDFNPAAERSTKYKRADVVGRRVTKAFPGIKKMGLLDVFKRVWATGIPERKSESMYTDNKRTLWTENYVFKLSTGEIVAIFDDVTEQKNTELALRAREELYRTIVENADECIWIIDKNGIITFANPKTTEMLGYSSEELIGRSIYSLMSEGSAVEAKKSNKLNANGTSKREEYEFINKNGAVLRISISTASMMDDSNNEIGTMILANDVTERKKLEASLRHAQKMEAIGTLAGGVAHEFRNILMGISAYTELIQMKLPKTDPIRQMTEDIIACIERGSKLTGQLLTFSRQQPMQIGIIDLNALVFDCGKLLKQILGEHISLNIDLKANPSFINGDPDQIQQVIMNLAINARDAMPNGGSLTITVDNTERRKLPITSYIEHSARPNNWILLTVSDTGKGIHPDAISRLFEPFYTTKENKSNTGLGLSVVHGIVTSHKGFIDVKSALGKGTDIRVYLPAAEEITAREIEYAEPQIVGGRETILLAEDDEMVRIPTADLLRRIGYNVLCAKDGEEAVDIFRANPREIDMVILDAVMPNKSGISAWEDIKSIRPNVNVLIVSGNVALLGDKWTAIEKRIPVLEKPFNFSDLAAAIRRILDNRESGRQQLMHYD
jgi:PAS domain S-box-containing protein